MDQKSWDSGSKFPGFLIDPPLIRGQFGQKGGSISFNYPDGLRITNKPVPPREQLKEYGVKKSVRRKLLLNSIARLKKYTFVHVSFAEPSSLVSFCVVLT